MSKIEQLHRMSSCSALTLFFMAGSKPVTVLQCLKNYIYPDKDGNRLQIRCNWTENLYYIEDFGIITCMLAYDGLSGCSKDFAQGIQVEQLKLMGFEPSSSGEWIYNKKNKSYTMIFTTSVENFVERLKTYYPELLEIEEQLRLRKEEQARRIAENQRETMECFVRNLSSQEQGVIA